MVEIFPERKREIVLSGSIQLDCYVTNDTGNNKIQQILGHNGKSMSTACVSCPSITCPDNYLLCNVAVNVARDLTV